MSNINPYAVKQLVDASRQLHASRLYERFSNHDCFLIRMPGLDEPTLVVLMGHGGQTFGLNLFLGPEAIASYRALFESAGSPSRRVMQQMRMVGYQMSDALDLSLDARRWFKKAKIQPNTKGLMPDPMSLEPGKVPRVILNDHETSLLLSAARGILKAAESQAFAPNGIAHDGRVLCLTLQGAYDKPDVTIDWQTVKQPGALTDQAPRSSADHGPVRGRFDLSGLTSSGDQWLVALMPVHGHVEGDDRQPFMLVVSSEQSLGFQWVLLMQPEPGAIVESLAAMMRGDEGGENTRSKSQGLAMSPPPKGLPARLIIDGASLYEAIAPAFEPLGILCTDGSGHPGVRMTVDQLKEAFDENFESFGDEHEGLPGQDDGLRTPAADDIQGWKRLDAWLKDEMYWGFDHDDRFRGGRALTRYFGPDADPQALIKKYRNLMVIDSYAIWFTFNYRSARNRPTLAEQWLNKPQIPASVKPLLQVIHASSPSLYRVEEADEDTGKITLIDLFTGEITIATDFALSTCIKSGWVLPARLVPVGDFHLYYAAGPILTGGEISIAIELLKQQTPSTPPELFREEPHVLGRLWNEIDRSRGKAFDLRNRDGHVLQFHEATLICTDRRAVERLLQQRADWHPDGDSPDAWVWLRTDNTISPIKNPDAKVIETYIESPDGNATVLAQLELDKRTITLHTNSRERHEAACAILTQLRSVSFLQVQVNDPTQTGLRDDEQDLPHEPLEMDQEAIQSLHNYFAAYYRQWLDHPIPMLHDHTPRQAAQHPKLRLQLAAMIRAIPDPAGHGSSGITLAATRQMLLTELGLDNDTNA